MITIQFADDTAKQYNPITYNFKDGWLHIWFRHQSYHFPAHRVLSVSEQMN